MLFVNSECKVWILSIEGKDKVCVDEGTIINNVITELEIVKSLNELIGLSFCNGMNDNKQIANYGKL